MFIILVPYSVRNCSFVCEKESAKAQIHWNPVAVAIAQLGLKLVDSLSISNCVIKSNKNLYGRVVFLSFHKIVLKRSILEILMQLTR